MSIGELARAAGVSIKTVRYYESIGLLPEPRRTPAGHRVYSAEMVDRIGFIRRAQSSGLSLAEIGSVLEIKDAGGRSCEHTRALLEGHLAHLDAQMEELRVIRGEVAKLAARADELDPSACRDPNRCQVLSGEPAR